MPLPRLFCFSEVCCTPAVLIELVSHNKIIGIKITIEIVAIHTTILFESFIYSDKESKFSKTLDSPHQVLGGLCRRIVIKALTASDHRGRTTH